MHKSSIHQHLKIHPILHNSIYCIFYIYSLKKNFILVTLIISISILAIFGFQVNSNPEFFPFEIVQSLRETRDLFLKNLNTAERSIGIPINAKVVDSNFTVEEYVVGLHQPTSMTFIGNDLLVLEKNNGHVKLIRNDKLQSVPILDLEVAYTNESGLLGITNNGNDVFLYLSESETDGGAAIGNNIYRYSWTGNDLQDPILLTSLSSESSWHNGGALTIDQNGNVLAVIGDQMGGGRPDLKNEFRILQNVNNGEIDDTGIIVKVGFEDNVIQPKKSDTPLEHYYAIGIRNSFGLAIDPFTGNLWGYGKWTRSF